MINIAAMINLAEISSLRISQLKKMEIMVLI
jgi:hypothetical protein